MTSSPVSRRRRVGAIIALTAAGILAPVSTLSTQSRDTAPSDPSATQPAPSTPAPDPETVPTPVPTPVTEPGPTPTDPTPVTEPGPIESVPTSTPLPGTDVPGTDVPGTDVPVAVDAAPYPDEHVVRPIVFPVLGAVDYGNAFNECRTLTSDDGNADPVMSPAPGGSTSPAPEGTGPTPATVVNEACARRHRGVDVAGRRLQPVVAMVDGRVGQLLTDQASTGFGVTLVDADGFRYDVYHLNNDSPGTDDGAAPTAFRVAAGLSAGDRVHAGQLLGFMGDSGNAEDGAVHIHVEIVAPDGQPVNPYWSLVAAQRTTDCAADDGVAVPGSDLALGRAPGSGVPDGWTQVDIGSGAILVGDGQFVPLTIGALHVGDPALGRGCDHPTPDPRGRCRSVLHSVGEVLSVVQTNAFVSHEGRLYAALPTETADSACATLVVEVVQPPLTITITRHQAFVTPTASPVRPGQRLTGK